MKKTKNRLSVLEVLGSYVDGCPPPHPANRIRIAMDNECSKQHIHKTLNDLLVGGFVVVSRKKQHGYDGKLPYWLNFYELAESVIAEFEVKHIETSEAKAKAEAERIKVSDSEAKAEDKRIKASEAIEAKAEAKRIKELKSAVETFCTTTDKAIKAHEKIFTRVINSSMASRKRMSKRLTTADVEKLITEARSKMQSTHPDKSLHFNDEFIRLRKMVTEIRALTNLVKT